MTFSPILTAAGRAAVTNAMLLNQKLPITEFAIGSGDNNQTYQPTENETALKGEEYRTGINAISLDPNNQDRLIIECIIPSNIGGWYMREIGIYDGDGNLIIVSRVPTTWKAQVTEGATQDQRFIIRLDTAHADGFELKIDPAIVLASRQYVADLLAAHMTDDSHLGPKHVQTTHLADLSVTTPKLADDAVTGPKINRALTMQAGQSVDAIVSPIPIGGAAILDLSKPLQHIIVTGDTTIYPTNPDGVAMASDILMDNSGGHSLALGVVGLAAGTNMATWNKIGTPVVFVPDPGNLLTPNGNDAAAFVKSATAQSESVYSAEAIETNLKYTASVYVKNPPGNPFNLVEFHVYGSSVAQAVRLRFNMATKEFDSEIFEGVIVPHSHGHIDAGDGWSRLWTTLELTGGETGRNIRVYGCGSDGTTGSAGDGSNGFYIGDPMWQVGELGPFKPGGALAFENDFSANLPADGAGLLSLRSINGQVFGGVTK